MSSTYRILCLSHDPAIECGEYPRPHDAEAAIRDGITEHPSCDLLIGRYSYPLVEIGCPPSRHQPKNPRPDALRCYHASTKWTDRDWLLILAAAYQSADPGVRDAIKAGSHACLPWERLRRLRVELDIPLKEGPSA